MTDKDWTTFFALLGKIVRLPLPTWQEKQAVVEDEAKNHDATDSLSEFVGWFAELPEEL